MEIIVIYYILFLFNRLYQLVENPLAFRIYYQRDNFSVSTGNEIQITFLTVSRGN